MTGTRPEVFYIEGKFQRFVIVDGPWHRPQRDETGAANRGIKSGNERRAVAIPAIYPGVVAAAPWHHRRVFLLDPAAMLEDVQCGFLPVRSHHI